MTQANSIQDLAATAVRLTQFSHGGGCGCKIAPGVLSELLRGVRGLPVPPELMVGLETSDDAAVYRLNAHQALVATTDFFLPIVDDPHDFGRIAATNAISDVYAMGATPILALALVGMPLDRLAPEVIGRILAGGASVCGAIGIPVAGGHTIDSVEPIYGLVVLGLVHPDKVKTNAGARAGDVLVLGKPLGIGVMSAALRRDALDSAGYAAMLDCATRLNTPGRALAELEAVHAMTDVTGFGLLGHLLELCRGAGLSAALKMAAIPRLAGVDALVEAGHVTGASARNWQACASEVGLDEAISAATTRHPDRPADQRRPARGLCSRGSGCSAGDLPRRGPCRRNRDRPSATGPRARACRTLTARQGSASCRLATNDQKPSGLSLPRSWDGLRTPASHVTANRAAPDGYQSRRNVKRSNRPDRRASNAAPG